MPQPPHMQFLFIQPIILQIITRGVLALVPSLQPPQPTRTIAKKIPHSRQWIIQMLSIFEYILNIVKSWLCSFQITRTLVRLFQRIRAITSGNIQWVILSISIFEYILNIVKSWLCSFQITRTLVRVSCVPKNQSDN